MSAMSNSRKCNHCGGPIVNHRNEKFCSMRCKRASRVPPEQRFWPKVRKTSTCWLWTGMKHYKFGYGFFQVGIGDRQLAHRISWKIHNGPIPDGLYVLHKCDTPPCVNPDHLFLGTYYDNMDDMDQKGRRAMPPQEPGKRGGRQKGKLSQTTKAI